MTQHTRTPGITGGTALDASTVSTVGTVGTVGAVGTAGSRGALPAVRCADAARGRGESLEASAVRYSRFLLLEVPGPWGTSALDGRHLEAGVAAQLASAAKAAGVHVLLIRRAGRHPQVAAGTAGTGGTGGTGGRPMAWAIADTAPGAERVLWGSWRESADLLGLELSAELPATAHATGPQRLALVCTNGKRDQCCALRGRPVAAAIAHGTDWDTWECSHLGGHRFAATIMLLPTGDMFGWLDQESGVEVTRRFGAGQIVMSYHRGRCGQPEPVQAALHAAALRLGDFRRGAVRAALARPLPAGWDGGRTERAADDRAADDQSADDQSADDQSAADAERWEVEVIHEARDGQEAAYRVVLAGSRLESTFLSCGDGTPRAETRYEALSFSRLP